MKIFKRTHLKYSCMTDLNQFLAWNLGLATAVSGLTVSNNNTQFSTPTYRKNFNIKNMTAHRKIS